MEGLLLLPRSDHSPPIAAPTLTPGGSPGWPPLHGSSDSSHHTGPDSSASTWPSLIDAIREAAWPDGPACPECHSTVIIRYGKRKGVQRYRCKDCFRCFSDFTGTALQGIRRPEKFLDFCACMVEGLTVRAAAARVGVCKNTSFAWRHKVISTLAACDQKTTLSGIVELAQRKVIMSFKGSEPPFDAVLDMLCESMPFRQRARNPLSPGIPPSRIVYLLLALDRTGRVRAKVLSPTAGPTFSAAVNEIAPSSAKVCVERGPGIWPAPSEREPRLSWVGRGRGRMSPVDESVDGPLYHVQNVKRLMRDYRRWELRFHGIATKYLLRYVAWFWRVCSLASVQIDVAARRLLIELARAGPVLTQPECAEVV